MDGLAIELLEKIATFACTDGGRTGLSLSLTSRYIRDATRATRFHSISLGLTTNSKEQISQFLSHFHAERAALSDRITLRIRHLCIAPAKGAAEICKEVAPDLYTLALVRGQHPALRDPDVMDVSGIDFPLLQELTILGIGSEFGVVTPHPKLPSLTRLHILPLPTKKLVCAPDLRLWSRRAPGVTHLRIAFIDDKNVVLKAEIENIAAPELLGLPVMFPKLEEALIQTTYILQGISGGPTDSTFESHSLATRALTILAGIRTTLGQLDLEVQREWWNGIGGGPGCWVGKADHVASQGVRVGE